MAKYIDPVEVSAQVVTFAYLLGKIDKDSAVTEKTALGLLCIGYMISDNVNAMIADFEKEVDDLREKLKAAKDGRE